MPVAPTILGMVPMLVAAMLMDGLLLVHCRTCKLKDLREGPSGVSVPMPDTWNIPNDCTTLDLSGTGMGEIAAIKLAEALKSNKALTKLLLRNNAINERGGIAIAKALKGNTAILMFDLEENNIGISGHAAIAKASGRELFHSKDYAKDVAHQAEVSTLKDVIAQQAKLIKDLQHLVKLKDNLDKATKEAAATITEVSNLWTRILGCSVIVILMVIGGLYYLWPSSDYKSWGIRCNGGVEIKNAAGLNGPTVNGIFEKTDEARNGKPVYQKVGSNGFVVCWYENQFIGFHRESAREH